MSDKNLLFPITLIIICISLVASGFYLMDKINESLDLNIIIEKIQTNQTYVDELTCGQVKQMIGLLNSQFMDLDHTDELLLEYEKLNILKRCDSEVLK